MRFTTCCSHSASPRGPWATPPSNHQKMLKNEPWDAILPKNPGLPHILQRHREQQVQDISIRGQRERTKLIQPRSFPLTCPYCGNVKECSKTRLYTSRVRSITCNTCNRAIVASKWSCPCALPWLQCQAHRRNGFACGIAKASGKFASTNRAQTL